MEINAEGDVSKNEFKTAEFNAALNLYVYEGNLFWSKITAMLVANTILFTFLGLIAVSEQEFSFIAIPLCIFGIFICIIFAISTKRGLEYARYWMLTAREIESSMQQEGSDMISRLDQFRTGKKVNFNIDECEEKHTIENYRLAGIKLSNILGQNEYFSLTLSISFILAYLTFGFIILFS